MLKFLMQIQKYEKKKISIKGRVLVALVADNFLKKAIGLMYRESIPSKTCMLFVFHSTGRHGIWMKNMNFAIDILWLNERKKIIDINNDVRPDDGLTHFPSGNALYVLELPAGFARKNKVKLGEVVHWPVAAR